MPQANASMLTVGNVSSYVGFTNTSADEYISAKEECANVGFNLANATESEINGFTKEQLEAGNCGEALALLQLKKMLVNTVCLV